MQPEFSDRNKHGLGNRTGFAYHPSWTVQQQGMYLVHESSEEIMME